MNWFIVVYLFLFIYMPLIFPINILHVLSLFSGVAIFFKYNKQIVRIFKKSKLINVFIIFFIAFFYLLILIWVTSGKFLLLYTYFMIAFEVTICSLYIILYFNSRGYSYYYLLKMILVAGLIQSLISIAAFIFPQLQNAIANLFIKNGLADVIFKFSYYRFYGFSSYLTSTAPLTQSVIAIIALVLGIYKNKKYFLFLPFLLFSAIINSRTSIVVFGLGLIVIMLVPIGQLNIKRIISNALVFVLGLFIFKILLNIFESNAVNTYNWIINGLGEIGYFLTGNNIGYFDVLINRMISFPEGFGLLFGKGVSLFGIEERSSDVGFINSLWIGGLLLTILVYGGLLTFYIHPIKYKDTIIKCISLTIVLAFLVANIKGSTISANEFANLSILITSMMIFSSERPNHMTANKHKIKWKENM